MLSRMIRTACKERRLTVQELADRAGVSRGLVQRIESGDLKCEIGANCRYDPVYNHWGTVYPSPVVYVMPHRMPGEDM